MVRTCCSFCKWFSFSGCRAITKYSKPKFSGWYLVFQPTFIGKLCTYAETLDSLSLSVSSSKIPSSSDSPIFTLALVNIHQNAYFLFYAFMINLYILLNFWIIYVGQNSWITRTRIKNSLHEKVQHGGSNITFNVKGFQKHWTGPFFLLHGVTILVQWAVTTGHDKHAHFKSLGLREWVIRSCYVDREFNLYWSADRHVAKP